MAKAHLLSSPGFLPRLLYNVVALAALWSAPFVRSAAYGAYDGAKLQSLDAASSYGAWAVVGLLSSSCCALQLVLNAFSVGCGGFNSYLGPLRPSFIALAIAAQAAAWSPAGLVHDEV